MPIYGQLTMRHSVDWPVIPAMRWESLSVVQPGELGVPVSAGPVIAMKLM